MSESKWFWHIHHTMLVERSWEDGIGARITHINSFKPRRERARRLRLMKKVKNQALMQHLQGASWMANSLPYRQKLRYAIRRVINILHEQECPKCPWDGHTIFPKPKRRAK